MAEVQAHTVERTLVLLKPDALARGLAGRVISRFEDAALKIVGTKMKWMDEEFTRKHYFDLEERLGGRGLQRHLDVHAAGSGHRPGAGRLRRNRDGPQDRR